MVRLWVNVGECVCSHTPYITVVKPISHLTPSLSFSLFTPSLSSPHHLSSPHLSSLPSLLLFFTPSLFSPSLSHLSLRYGRPYVYDEKYHPTKWVADRAIAYLEAQATAQQQQQQQQQQQPQQTTTTNFLAKISFHRPHSPYDPPSRILDSITEEDLPPMVQCTGAGEKPWTAMPSNDSGHGDHWCLRFRGDAQGTLP